MNGERSFLYAKWQVGCCVSIAQRYGMKLVTTPNGLLITLVMSTVKQL